MIAIIAIGTLIEALISFGLNAGKQLIDNNWNFKDVDCGSVLNDAIVGAGVAFLGSTTLSFGAGLDYFRKTYFS